MRTYNKIVDLREYMNINRAYITTLLFAMIAALPGCAALAPSVQTNVSIFHDLQPTPSPGTTFDVVPWRKELSDSLEFRSYAGQVAQKLQLIGYQKVDQGAQPSLIVFMDYGIDDGRTVTTQYNIPQYGVTGYSGSRTTGTVSTYGSVSQLNAYTTRTPTYGVTGYQTGTTSDTVYKRFMNVDIVSSTQSEPRNRKVFEAKVRSEGTCGSLPSIIPTLIESLFQGFPGKSGASVVRNMPWTGAC